MCKKSRILLSCIAALLLLIPTAFSTDVRIIRSQFANDAALHQISVSHAVFTRLLATREARKGFLVFNQSPFEVRVATTSTPSATNFFVLLSSGVLSGDTYVGGIYARVVAAAGVTISVWEEW